MARAQMDLLLAMVDQAFDHQSWHGTNLRGSVRGMDAKTAAWRPSQGRHNIWELTVHAAYWKYAVLRRLRGERRGSFALKGSNWFTRPADASADEASWKADVALLVETHRALRDAIAGLSDKDLPVIPPNSKVSNMKLITGIAAHDLYHAGQIQLLKRLQEK